MALAEEGHQVYGTSRDPSTVDLEGVAFKALTLDVNDAKSVEACVRRILEENGRLDVVVNNAGFSYGGAVEDTSVEETKMLFETNVFGILRVCHAVLPIMRAQRQGLIVNVSSIAGRIGAPYQGVYSASKFAVEGLTETLRMEVKRFGIDVVLIEPGDISTTPNRRHTAASQSRELYRDQYAMTLAKIEADERGGTPAEAVARLLRQIVNQEAPRLRYMVGPLHQKLAVWAKCFLPAKLFEWGMMKTYKL